MRSNTIEHSVSNILVVKNLGNPVKKTLLISACLLASSCGHSPDSQTLSSFDPIAYVDPLIGTDGKGKTFPGATVPHGMVQLSPDNGRTGWDWIAGYFYPDNLIAGFSHTHLSGTGAGDLYDISFMPLTRPFYREKTEGGPKEGTIVSRFSHDKETASPGYYQVYLQDYGINVELTAGLRTGFQRYHFPEGKKEGVIRLDLGYSRNWDKTLETHVEVLDPYTITGYRKSTGWASDQRVYFYTRLSEPMTSHQLTKEGEVVTAANEATGENIALEMSFDLNHRSRVAVRTALSSVSMESAKANLMADGKNETFAHTREGAENAWRDELSKVVVKADDDNLRQFYTAMYHASLAPRLFSDNDGRYKGPDGVVHKIRAYQGEVQPRPRYEFFSLWDTFRALHPWKTIIDPARTQDMMASIYSHYEVTGTLPVWNFQGNETDMMMGYHSVPVMVDAYFKGLLPMDGEALLEAAIKSATQQKFGIDSYQKLGYVPYEERGWNVSLTLEYAYDDWAIAQLAKALGKDNIYQTYLKRSENYRNHFDSTTGFMRAKNAAGDYRQPFDPLAYHPEDYCEANAWQYNFFVPHAVDNMIEMMGGNQAFIKKLDEMFTTEQASDKLPEWISGFIGQYVHGNEPSHHVPYLYQYAGAGHKTQQLVRKIMDELYTTQPDGLAGNEDAGQMSAWYLFSALGFYPVDPIAGEYVLGSPEIEEAVIHLANGNTFTVKAKNQSPKNVYVQSVTLNGKPLTGFTLSHQAVINGGELIFTMSSKQP